MSSLGIPPGYTERLYAPALVEIVALLKLIAGDPTTVDQALVYEQGTVTDTVAVAIQRVQAQIENYSILIVAFSETSGRGRYLPTGSSPTAAGVGMPILSGGAVIIVRGTDNINRFRMIAETGQTMEYNALLFQAQAWMGKRA